MIITYEIPLNRWMCRTEREKESVCVEVLFVVCVFHLITFIILLFNVHAGVVAPYGRRTVVDVAARAHPLLVCVCRAWLHHHTRRGMQ